MLPSNPLRRKILVLRTDYSWDRLRWAIRRGVACGLRFSGGSLIAAGSFQASGALSPKATDVVGFAEMVGNQLKERLGTLVPEFLCSFDTSVDLLDGRFDVATGDGQACSTILGVLHPRALILDVPQRFGDDPPGARFRVAFLRRSQFVAAIVEREDQRLRVA